MSIGYATQPGVNSGTGLPVTMNRYVSTTGSNANDGLSPSTPWLTITYAIQQQPLLCSGIYQINVADGTYLESLVPKDFVGNAADTNQGNSIIKIVGNVTTPANVIIRSGTNPVVLTNTRCVFVIDGVTLDGNGTSNGAVLAFNGIFDLVNVAIQNCNIGLQMNENSRGRWLAGSAGGTVAVTGTGITMSRGSSLSLQRPVTITGFTGFGMSASAGALLGITAATTTLTLTGNNAIAGIQCSTNAFVSVSSATLNISNITGSANGYAIRCINDGVFVLNNGITLNLTNCTRPLQVASSSYFQDGPTGNAWNYLGGTLNVIRVDSTCLVFSPNTFSGASVESTTNAGYIEGGWWNKQDVITGSTALNGSHYSVKCNHGAAINVTLPLSASVNVGRIYTIGDITGNAAVNNITILPSGADTINGLGALVINANYGSRTVEAVTGGWVVNV